MGLALHEISIVVLSGGQGRRMSGQNKGLIELDGKPMIQHVLERLVQGCGEEHVNILISANSDLDVYRRFGYPVISDIPLEDRNQAFGPLHGLYSAMQSITNDWLLSVPCDCPKIPLDYCKRMTAHSDKALAFVADDGARMHNGCVLLHKSLQQEILARLQKQQLAMYRFLQDIGAHCVDFSDQAEGFVNINTNDELQQVSQR